MPEEVLLVEDNPGDARLVREAMRAANPSIRLCLTYDGVMAMTFLKREGAYVRAPRPKLILLDLNLPRMNGREVLSRIKSDESLKSIPTIVLTTSDAEADIAQSYQLNANCYLRKPVRLEAFESLMKNVVDLWLPNVSLPLAGATRLSH
jgi:two-component system, chemotaxis family, response regulator Rcp1